MRIVRARQAINAKKEDGTNANYYLFDEYEIHIDSQKPYSTQTWHCHKEVHETLIVLEGELIFAWKEKDSINEEVIKQGDMVETGTTFHTFKNISDKEVRFIVIKQILSGQNKRDILKNDKVLSD